MPTVRTRHVVTESDVVEKILDDAAARWGLDVSRPRLIGLILNDWASGGRSPAARAVARRSLEGSLADSGQGYERSEDWPA